MRCEDLYLSVGISTYGALCGAVFTITMIKTPEPAGQEGCEYIE